MIREFRVYCLAVNNSLAWRFIFFFLNKIKLCNWVIESQFPYILDCVAS